jgi:hypothetical protein
MVAVANLAVVQRRAPGRRINEREQTEMRATIVRLQRAGTFEAMSVSEMTEEEKENGLKRLFQKFTFWRDGRRKDLEDNSSDSSDNDGEIPVARTFRSRGALSREAVQRQRAVDQGAVEITAPTSASQERPESRVNTLSQTRPSSASGSLFAAAPQKNGVEDSTQSSTGRAARSVSPNAANPQEDSDGAREAEASTNLDSADSPSAVGANIALEDVDGTYEAGPAQLVANDVSGRAVDQGGKEAVSGTMFVDVAVQTSAEEHGSQSHQPSTTVPETTATIHGPSANTSSNPNLPNKTSQHHQGPSGKGALVGDKSIDAEPFQNVLQAWISSILPGLSSGSGASLGIIELSLPKAEILALLRQQDAQHHSSTEALLELNPYQRRLVLAHTNALDSDLLYVGVWHNESVYTVFGALDVTSLIWITSSTEKREGSSDIETLFGKHGKKLRSKEGPDHHNFPGEITEDSDRKAAEEEAEPIAVDEQEKRNFAEAEKAKLASSEEAAKMKMSSPDHAKEPLHFKDAVGRKYNFPWHLVKTWAVSYHLTSRQTLNSF